MSASRARDSSNLVAAENYQLFCRYAECKGVEANAKEALRLFTLAATQDHAEAQYNLSLFILEVLVRQNLQEAVRLLTLAARQGHTET